MFILNISISDAVRKLNRLLNKVIVLGNRDHYAGYIRLLESVVSNNKIGCSWTAGSHAHPDFSSSPGIAVGHVGGSLLLPDKNMPDGGSGNFIIDWQSHPAPV